jgi:hypothetical protein
LEAKTTFFIGFVTCGLCQGRLLRERGSGNDGTIPIPVAWRHGARGMRQACPATDSMPFFQSPDDFIIQIILIFRHIVVFLHLFKKIFFRKKIIYGIIIKNLWQ